MSRTRERERRGDGIAGDARGAGRERLSFAAKLRLVHT